MKNLSLYLNTIYVHYGSGDFNKNKFKPISNNRTYNKPIGGLWACDCSLGLLWRDCIYDMELKGRDDAWFCFKINMNSKIVVIDSIENAYSLGDKYKLPIINDISRFHNKDFLIDWTLVAKDYDAVIFINIDDYNDYIDGLDVESICVFNHDILTLVESPKELYDYPPYNETDLFC